MATLHDVARLAEVSIATASRVLSDRPHGRPVSPKTREAVEQAAHALDYRPSAAARALKTGRSRLIGIIASDFLDTYYGEMASGIELGALRSGFVPMLATAKREPLEERSRLRMMREQDAAGVVFCGSPIKGATREKELAAEVEEAVRSGIRVVSLAPRGFGSLELIIDNEDTGYAITREFLRAGHQSIAFLAGTPGLASAEARARGYLRAMEEAGLPPQLTGRTGMTHEDGRIAARESMAGRVRPSALVATNDELALGALAELWALGFDVPSDVSVGCVGGTRMTRAFEMTHLALPLVELGEIAAAYVTADTPPAAATITVPSYRFVPGRTLLPDT